MPPHEQATSFQCQEVRTRDSPSEATGENTNSKIYRNSDTLKELWISERELNDLTQLSNLFAQATNLVVRNVARVFMRHVVHEGINLNI